MLRNSLSRQYEYDFAISFAGKNRDIAETLDGLLRNGGANVFYDRNFEASLLGKNFQEEWRKICKSSRYVIVIVSEDYTKGEWTLFELEVAKKAALRRETEYLLPILLDSTEVVGLPYTTSHIDLRNRDIIVVAKALLRKLEIATQQGRRKKITAEYKKRLDYLSEYIVCEQILKFNEYRKDENFAPLNLKHLDVGGDWELDGKLRPLNLDNIDLRKSFLSQADLTGITMKNSDTSGSTYYLTNLSEARFVNVNFSNCFIQQADLYDCFMRNCDLTNSNFSIANLFTAHFSNCCFYHTNFSYAKCNNASFRNCLLHSVDFSNADVTEASFNSSLLLNIKHFDKLKCLEASFTDALINNEQLVNFLRNQGAKNVPDALTDRQEIGRRLLQMSCTDSIVDKILQDLQNISD